MPAREITIFPEKKSKLVIFYLSFKIHQTKTKLNGMDS